MTRFPLRHTADQLVRRELGMVGEIAKAIQVSGDELRHALQLSEAEWEDWVAFMRSGPMPKAPSVGEMLRRVGMAGHRLVRAAEG